MKQFFILLTAIICCLCLAACTEQAQETQPRESVSQTEHTAAAESSSAPEQAETKSTEVFDYTVPFGSQDGLTPGDNVISPDEMPEKPEVDYELPPDNPIKGETS